MSYRPSLAANISILVLYALSGFLHIIQGTITKKPYFMYAMVLGVISEVIGYGGRIMSYQNPFSLNGFLINICCITLAPVFFIAAIYFTLGDIVWTVSPAASRRKPSTYAKIFIPCDIVSLVVQGVGGGLASTEGQNGSNVNTPTHVLVAGLAFQTFTTAIFVGLTLEYFFRVWKLNRVHPEQVRMMTQSKIPFVVFVVFLSLAIVTIFIRTVYRVAELSGGWSGKLYTTQRLFITLEGVMVLIAVYSLHLGHPGNLFRGKRRTVGGVDGEKELGIGRVPN